MKNFLNFLLINVLIISLLHAQENTKEAVKTPTEQKPAEPTKVVEQKNEKSVTDAKPTQPVNAPEQKLAVATDAKSAQPSTTNAQKPATTTETKTLATIPPVTTSTITVPTISKTNEKTEVKSAENKPAETKKEVTTTDQKSTTTQQQPVTTSTKPILEAKPIDNKKPEEKPIQVAKTESASVTDKMTDKEIKKNEKKEEKSTDIKCESNQVSYNKTCGYCPTDSKYDKKTNKCICNNKNSIITRNTVTVDNKNYFSCIPCTENLKPNKDNTECICKHFDNDRKKVKCNRYATNDIKYNRENGTYKCNNPDLVIGFDEKKQVLKCYACPTDSKFDKENGVCICTKPDAKNTSNKIEYPPLVEGDKLVCNPHGK